MYAMSQYLEVIISQLTGKPTNMNPRARYMVWPDLYLTDSADLLRRHREVTTDSLDLFETNVRNDEKVLHACERDGGDYNNNHNDIKLLNTVCKHAEMSPYTCHRANDCRTAPRQRTKLAEMTTYSRNNFRDDVKLSTKSSAKAHVRQRQSHYPCHGARQKQNVRNVRNGLVETDNIKNLPQAYIRLTLRKFATVQDV